MRALKERQQAKDMNLTMKNMLDQQVAHNSFVKRTGKQTEIETGQE